MTDNLKPAGIDAAMAILSHYGVKEEHARIAVRAYEAEKVSDTAKVAAWMIIRSYATGHGDTIEDLLSELEWQAKERAVGNLKAATAIRKV